MRICLQRVKEASVSVDDEIVGQIRHGLVLLAGITHDDTKAEARFLADKCVNLRIFGDHDGKFNLSARDVGAEILAVSQFTLYGDSRKGRRPSFIEAARPDLAEPLFNTFVEYLKESRLKVETGVFGAMMLVSIENDGPVTLILEKQL